MSLVKFINGISEYQENFNGTVYSVVCTGTSGQTATLKASIDKNNWVDIVNFTIDTPAKPIGTTLQFAYPYLKIEGTANIKVARG